MSASVNDIGIVLSHAAHVWQRALSRHGDRRTSFARHLFVFYCIISILCVFLYFVLNFLHCSTGQLLTSGTVKKIKHKIQKYLSVDVIGTLYT